MLKKLYCLKISTSIQLNVDFPDVNTRIICVNVQNYVSIYPFFSVNKPYLNKIMVVPACTCYLHVPFSLSLFVGTCMHGKTPDQQPLKTSRNTEERCTTPQPPCWPKTSNSARTQRQMLGQIVHKLDIEN